MNSLSQYAQDLHRLEPDNMPAPQWEGQKVPPLSKELFAIAI